MTSKLKDIDYGKSRVRVAKIKRLPDRHDFCDLTVAIRLQGSFEDSYLTGDNSLIVPTDTMKNSVYAIAGASDLEPIELFARRLGEHFLSTHQHVTSAWIEVVEHQWDRIDPYAFEQGQARRLATVAVKRDSVTIHAGIDNLVLLKTTKSSFEGFLKDKFTTLKEASDRIFATAISVVWKYEKADANFDHIMLASRRTMIDVFTAHNSRAVQETLYAMGDAVLQAHPEIGEIRLTLPNKHYLPVNLEPFGLENRNEVFLPTDEPCGVIEACLTR